MRRLTRRRSALSRWRAAVASHRARRRQRRRSVNQATVARAMQYARQGIRANCIMPCLIDTPLIYNQISSQYETTDDMVAARNAMVPLGHMGTAWDVAAAAVFLASDEARFITGVCLPVDGGQSCAAGGAV